MSTPAPATAPTFTARIIGTPAPKGSKKHVGRGRLVESSKKLPAWRHALDTQLAVAGSGTEPIDRNSPVWCHLEFHLHRPQAARKHQRWQVRYPDLDKLCRAVLDELTGRAYWDDAQVAVLTASKELASPPGHTGVTITVGRL
jgi:crossover junction endodeoxyribonuclease RusA